MIERKQKTFQYRYVEGLKDGKTLTQLLQPVLFTTHRTVGARSEPVIVDDPLEDVRRCINHKIHSGEMLFGELILYVKGTNKQVVTVDENLEELPTEQIRAPKTETGEQREFIDGVVYFAALDNHMVIVQSTALRDRELESHLNWLLREKAKSLQEIESIVLRRELSMTAKEQMPEVRTIEVGAPLLYQTLDETQKNNTAPLTQHSKIRITDLGYELLQTLVGAEKLEELDLGQYGRADNLEISLMIKRKNGTRAPDSPAERAMAALTTHLRHSHDQDIRVEAKGGRLTGDTLYLMEKVSVECANGIPSRHDLFENMRKWLSGKIEDGSVLP